MDLLLQKNYVDGKWIEIDPDAAMAVENPVDHELIGYVPDASDAQIEQAIMAAHQARESWADVDAYSRSRLLRRLYELMIEQKEELARIMTLENGKNIAEARAEIDYAASFIDWFAEEAKRNYGRTLPAAMAGRDIRVIHQPLGVVGVITPWNFPSSMLTRKIGAAFAAGCPVIVKPDHRTPYSAIALARLCEIAGFPPGVFNLITGDAEKIGRVFCTHPLIRKVTFTGSTRIGKILMAQSASTLKHLSFELGGNAPYILCEDADLDAAIDGLMIAKMRNTGQSCVAANRIFVHHSLYESFLEKLLPRVQKLQPGIDTGPLIDRNAVGKMGAFVRDAVAKGAKLLLGGQETPEGSYFYPPTILRDVPADADCERDEIFGPIFAVSSFDSDEQALARANAVPVGLASYVFTRDGKRANLYERKLAFGMVGVNTGMISFAGAPFGGYKESGFGREGGSEGIQAYLETKYIAVQY